jgi:hypothetical protein
LRNIKNKTFSFQFYEKDGKEIYEKLYDIFHDKFRINNSFEHFNRKIGIQGIEWHKISKKMIRTTLIHEYVIAKRKKWDLTHSQINKLLSNISLGLYFKLLIAKKHINYDKQNCKITDISGISFKKNRIFFENKGR